jgi:DNA-binding response OmpR family regulator
MYKKKILIFDDDIAVLNVLKQIFLEDGYDVEVSRTLQNVVECAEDFQPDLILIDYLIPEMRDTKPINELRNSQEFCHVAVILLSASTNIIKIKNISGANDYLIKPFNLSDLEAVVTKYLS